jgi:hypothetical protein
MTTFYPTRDDELQFQVNAETRLLCPGCESPYLHVSGARMKRDGEGRPAVVVAFWCEECSPAFKDPAYASDHGCVELHITNHKGYALVCWDVVEMVADAEAARAEQEYNR